MFNKRNAHATLGDNSRSALFIFFRMENYTDCLLPIKDNFVFSSIITTNIQKVSNTIDTGQYTHI